ncbi:malic enzyme-like NAD(P)-binding protein [Halodesulfovibrio spirochaetisodalis]|uniref:Malate dehydrogenase n=1 Tax=Halodesulfovibrio spirochaetisodalis TaxID=1560234 RepID=A0A1B7XBQ2_9BACT|nr:malic enzyme-like NAD(P)-binding protein [Halodesulfovibrio spirochaetisodalis]OBQ50194.1 malate dehydrogenase [Halodesulfovibrio spirochaetisodalis]
MALFTKEEALNYHAAPRRGKVEVVPVKPCNSQKDLSMAYSPGVAEACKEIHANPDAAALYTGRSNLVAVVSDGTAVLGLGNIGPLAGKPVMEGKGVLFKTFADIDVFDINLDVSSADELINIVKAMEPTFGGINLEDIKAPECFYIEETLKKEMNIPVFHDDQHGTAVISGAGLINACEITGRNIEDLKVVVVGAGAAGIACSKFYVSMGVKRENIFMFDSRGLIHKGREGLNQYKKEFAQDNDYGSLEEVIKGADCFLGLSVKNLLSQDMVRSMAKDPIIFAMANPDPEISYPDAKEASPNCIMGTGRSDFPNQVNNVSGFPYIFRGALDVGATIINEEMKLAAAKALAALAKEPVPQEICDAYGVKELTFGVDYVIPKPLDPRVLEWEVAAVAQAAMDTGVAQNPIKNMDAYKKSLRDRVTASNKRIAAFVDSYFTAS